MANSQRLMRLFLETFIVSLQWIATDQQINLALGGTAIQSSLFSNNYFAPFANDGDRNPDMAFLSCTATSFETNPWWRVDLLAVYDIFTVIITNRGDCCSDRINGAEIHIGNSLINNGNNNPRCARYVNINIPNVVQCLSLCEVEVYGVKVPVFKQALMRIKLNSSEDLTNPTMRDKILQKIKSAIVQPSVFKVRWSKEPEL